MPTPPAEVQAAVLAPTTEVVRYAEIYEYDGVTPWATLTDADILDGSVNVDYSRGERRTFSLTLSNLDGSVRHYPGGFWYDKIIKIFRGVMYTDENGTSMQWADQIGEFVIDTIESQHFPHTIQVSGRDYTKRLMTSKFVNTTSFAAGTLVVDVIRTIATNGDISKFNLYDPENKALGKVFTFERGTERWKAIKDIATAYGFELFFDALGYLTLRKFNDPALSPETHTFVTGEGIGNLISFRKRTSDARIYNHIVVAGESTDQTVPVWAEAINDEPSSPTRRGVAPGDTGGIGDRVYTYTSSYITTTEQAQSVANQFLQVHALEEFDLGLESLVIWWLEVGDIFQFVDPDPNPADPTRFLLTSLTIPLRLGAMSVSGKRVQVVT